MPCTDGIPSGIKNFLQKKTDRRAKGQENINHQIFRNGEYFACYANG